VCGIDLMTAATKMVERDSLTKYFSAHALAIRTEP
jgi:hypothetical protein